MSTLTIRIPEGKHERLRTLAKDRGISINRLMDELATVALTEYDSETRFRPQRKRLRLAHLPATSGGGTMGSFGSSSSTLRTSRSSTRTEGAITVVSAA